MMLVNLVQRNALLGAVMAASLAWMSGSGMAQASATSARGTAPTFPEGAVHRPLETFPSDENAPSSQFLSESQIVRLIHVGPSGHVASLTRETWGQYDPSSTYALVNAGRVVWVVQVFYPFLDSVGGEYSNAMTWLTIDAVTGQPLSVKITGHFLGGGPYRGKPSGT